MHSSRESFFFCILLGVFFVSFGLYLVDLRVGRPFINTVAYTSLNA